MLPICFVFDRPYWVLRRILHTISASILFYHHRECISILRKLHPLKRHHGPLCINNSSHRGVRSGRRRCLPRTAVVDTSSYHRIAPHGNFYRTTARNHRRERRNGTTRSRRFRTLLLTIGRQRCGRVVGGGGDRHRCRACLHRTAQCLVGRGGDCNDGNGIMAMGARGGGRGGGCFNNGDERIIESIANKLLERP